MTQPADRRLWQGKSSSTSGIDDATLSRVNPTPSDQASKLVADSAQVSSSASDANPGGGRPLCYHQRQQFPLLHTLSHQSRSTGDLDPVFTPPMSDMQADHGTLRDSSQESQLLQLSQLAATQEKLPAPDLTPAGATSRKRMADGAVKHARDRCSQSPTRNARHSRNTSIISMASTASSRITELSAELRDRLSYAMVKVKSGWQSHNIDQVEALASQAVSPTSSNSTIHQRNRASASPQVGTSTYRTSNNVTPITTGQHYPTRPADSHWRTSSQSRIYDLSPVSPATAAHPLARPVSMQPPQPPQWEARRNSLTRSRTFPSNAQASPTVGPYTPSQPTPYLESGVQRSVADPMHLSPPQNLREQNAIESLIMMSSPKNPASMKPMPGPSPSQAVLPSRVGTQRTALPTAQPRKSLPSGRPPHAHESSQPHKRVGFEKLSGEMDTDEPSGMPHPRGALRKKHNGNHTYGYGDSRAATPRHKLLPVSLGLSVPAQPRRPLADADIDRMLDSAAAEESSDSGEEIEIPGSRPGPEGPRLVEA